MIRTIDRREEYFGLAAAHIARDMLAFYTRAENGRRILAHMRTLASRFDVPKKPSARVLHLPNRRKA